MAKYANSQLETWDFVAVGIYFAAVIGVGIYSMCRAHRGSVSGYFLAGRYMFWLPVGASLFASNIGSEHFIGLAGSGAAAGIGVGSFELNALIMLQLLGWVFLPVYMASKVCTLPEFMKKRFGGNRIRIYLSVLSVVLYIFTKVSVNLYSGALFIQQALHWNLYVSIVLLLAVTAFCTVTGGLTAVIYTDTLQAFIMIAGASILTGLGFYKVGGYSGLYEKYSNAIPNTTLLSSNETCGFPRADAWTMLRDPVDSDIPWPGFLLGQTPASVWYWCADQMMVQRALAAKSLSHAQGGTLFAGYLKLLPLFIMIMPGMISRVLYPNEVACVDPDICEEVCGSRVGCSNIAFPKLVLELMPTGLRGVMMSVMLAALMSDLTSIFNSASTLFTMDIYRSFRKTASNRELMIVGRAFVCVMIGIGIAWIPTIQNMQGAQLYLYIQSVAAYLSPPIAAVYSISILWKRANESGAFWGLMVGAIVGVIRMVLDFVYVEPPCGKPDTRPTILANVHYMYFATILFWLTTLITVGISLLTEAPSKKQLIRVTYWTRYDQTLRDDEKVRQPPIDNNDKSNLVQLMDLPQSKASGDNAAIAESNSKDEAAAATTGLNYVDNQVLIVPKAVPEKTDMHETEEDQPNPSSSRYLVGRMCDWFCGLENDDDEEAARRAELQEAHLHNVTNLTQNRLTWFILNINLVILCALCVGLYIFFSVGTHLAQSTVNSKNRSFGNGTGHFIADSTT